VIDPHPLRTIALTASPPGAVPHVRMVLSGGVDHVAKGEFVAPASDKAAGVQPWATVRSSSEHYHLP
jgi:hypothetical protein